MCSRFNLLLLALLLQLASVCHAAPVVVIPGEGAGYVYYSAGGGAAAPPAADTSFVGMISAFSTTPPADTWVVCNGQTISKAAYPELVEFLAGAAATSAVMPNYQGYFLRGVNTGASGVDPGRTVGSVQGEAFKSHTHGGTTNSDGAHAHTWTMPYSFSGSGPVTLESGSVVGYHAQATSTDGDHTHAFTTGASGSVETRPVNIAVIYAMRAK